MVMALCDLLQVSGKAQAVIGDSRVRQISRQGRNGDGQGQEEWQLNVRGNA